MCGVKEKKTKRTHEYEKKGKLFLGAVSEHYIFLGGIL